MNYSLGCAFNLKHIVSNFPYKKLHITCKLCEKAIGDNHRQKLAIKVFRECLKLVIEDIIENNVTFWLPLTGSNKCNMHMKRVTGKEFKNLRRGGKWKDIDFLQSMFSGFEIRFFMLGNRTPRVKTVYLNKHYRDKITYYTNKCKNYGDGVNDTTVKNYYDKMYELFPDVPKTDIKRILSFCWKSLYLHNSYGGDTLITDNNFWCYIGNLKKDSLEHFFYYIRKLTVKLRVLYKRYKIKWDGYYYFALSNYLYEKYLKLKNSKGRPRKYFNFGTVFLYLIFDECKINEYYKKYIFKIPVVCKLKDKQFIRELKTDKAELVLIREPLKFKDILVYDNEYEFL